MSRTGTVLGQSSHQFMRFIRIRRRFSPIKIYSQSYVALVSNFLRLLFHPIVQSPPFVDDNDGGVAARFFRDGQKTVDGILAARKFDHFRFRAVRAHDENCDKQTNEKTSRDNAVHLLHERFLHVPGESLYMFTLLQMPGNRGSWDGKAEVT